MSEEAYGESWIDTDEDYTRAACGLVVHVDDLPDHATLLDPCEDCDRLRIAWDRVIYGDRSGVPTGITTERHR